MRQYNDGLRDYQIRAKKWIFEAWNHHANLLYQMPTGTGKTVVFASIIHDLNADAIRHNRRTKFLIVAHRTELLFQIQYILENRFHIHCGIIQGSLQTAPERNIQVASIQTLSRKRRLEWAQEQHFDYLFIDEAHHSAAATYRYLWDYLPDTKKLGVTATPYRLDRRGFSTLYDQLILSPGVSWFLENHYLCDYEYVSIRPDSQIQAKINSIVRYGRDGDFLIQELDRLFNNSRIRAHLLKAYLDFAKGRKGIVYAINVEHARKIAEMYADIGLRSVYIHAQTPAETRRTWVEEFRKGELDILVNVDIFSEGFDCPDVEFIQLARPTRSLSKYLQQVGRALRIHLGKQNAVILDNVGLYNHFGLPDAERNWTYYFEERLQKIAPETKSSISNCSDPTDSIQEFPEGNEEMVIVRFAQQESPSFPSPAIPPKPVTTPAPVSSETGESLFIKLWNDSLTRLTTPYTRINAVHILTDMIGNLDETEMESLARLFINANGSVLLHSLELYTDKQIIDTTLIRLITSICEIHQSTLSHSYYILKQILGNPYIIRFA